MYIVRLFTALVLGLVFSSTIANAEESRCGKRPTTIRIVSPFKAGHILVETAERFKTLVEARSQGRAIVTIDAGTVSEENADSLVVDGAVDIQATGGYYIQQYAPEYFFINSVLVLRDYAHFLRIWNGHLGDELRDLVEHHGNQLVLGVVSRGFRHTTSNGPIVLPSDVQGLKIRLPVIPMWTQLWRAIGANPIEITLPNLYLALQTGQAEASEGDLTQITSLRLWEVQSHLSLTRHHVNAGFFCANRNFVRRLPHGLRHIVTRALDDATAWGTRRMEDSEVALLDELKASGMKLVEANAEAFRQAARPAIEEQFRTAWPVTTWDEVLAL